MRIVAGCACALLFVAVGWTQQPAPAKQTDGGAAAAAVKQTLEANIKAEWDAFKKRDKQAYSDLLADDFMAVEDDGDGMRKKATAVAEVDRSVIYNYQLFALNVIPLDANAAMVSYEITFQFPPTAQVKFKRVLVSEIWLKRNGQWKERYYQETKVK